MNIIIQKFGGTSLRDINKENRFLSHVEKSIDNNEKSVIVVSAIGRKGEPYATDTLIEELEKINDQIDPSKKDLIMSCGETIAAVVVSHLLDTKGIPSQAFTGLQAGIITDNNFNSSNILNIDIEPILDSIDKGLVPVVAGFQGTTKDMQITTLGRGGSDITAVSLGAYLKADRVEIFTDVPGVAIIDPNLVPDTEYIKSINYDDMYILASKGAGVVHPRAVKIGKRCNTLIQVKSTFSDENGTTISSLQTRDTRPIIGIAIDSKANTNIITLVFNESFDNVSRNDFEKHLLKNELVAGTVWDRKNTLSILVKFHNIKHLGRKIYEYFF